MRCSWRRRFALWGLAFLACSGLLFAGTNSESYQDVNVSITAPDVVPAGMDFPVEVQGFINGGSPFSIFAYSVYMDAQWLYTSNHMAGVTSGLQVDGSGFNWGSSFGNLYSFNLPQGTYKFTFVMGQRSTGQGWYDVAVDLFVTVGEESGDVNGGDEDEDQDERQDEGSDEDEGGDVDPDPTGPPL